MRSMRKNGFTRIKNVKIDVSDVNNYGKVKALANGLITKVLIDGSLV